MPEVFCLPKEVKGAPASFWKPSWDAGPCLACLLLLLPPLQLLSMGKNRITAEQPCY